MRSVKTELHCHSMPASACAKHTPAELLERYAAAGYSTVVLTNHLGKGNSDKCEERYGGPNASADWQRRIDFLMKDYTDLCAAAKKVGIHALFGVEIRLDYHTDTDFLVYGDTEAFLRDTPGLLAMKIKEFSAAVRGAGFLLVQAHPFRNKMTITDPALLDGIEIYNATPGHFSRNDVAEYWARRFDLIGTSGTDLHRPEQPIAGGILTDAPITSNEALLTVLRARDFDLIRAGTPGEDGLQIDISGIAK